MKFVKTSFIPQKKINLALVDNRITSEMTNTLKKLNIDTIKTSRCENTYDAISYHPDITLIKLNDNNILVCPNMYEYYNKILSPLGFNVIKGNSPIEKKYPNNVQYNEAILGDKIIHNFNKNLLHFWATDYFACSEDAGKWMFKKQYLHIKNSTDLDKFKFNRYKNVI